MVGNIMLVFISYSVLAGLISGDNLTWINSASRCTLANRQEIQTLNESYPLSWIGGYYLTTPWVAYLGCFYNVTSFNDDSDRYPNISSAACLSKCDAFKYFTLEYEHCRCLTSKKNLQTTHPEDCKSGKRHKYFSVYKTIKITKDSENPIDFNNQKLQCTIIHFDKKTKKLTVKAAKCDIKHSVLCQTSEKEFSVIDDNNYTYAVAQKKCNILDYYSVKDSHSLQNITFEGKSYWTNILRFSTEQWVDNTTDIDALKDITKNMRNQRCLSASQKVGYLPAERQLPCNNVLSFRCSPAHTPAITADTLNTGIYRNTTSSDSLDMYSEAKSKSYNTTDSNGNGYEPFEEYEEIDRTRITEVFIIIIGITAFLSILIISAAIFVLYLYRQKRKQYNLEIQGQNSIKTRRDIYFATEDICSSDHLGLQWIPSESDIRRLSMPMLNTDNSAYTALTSVGQDTSTNNVNTENATYTTLKSNEQGSSTQNVNSENAANPGLHTIRPDSSTINVNTKNAISTAVKSVRQGTSTNKANNKNAAYTAVKLVRHNIPSNKVDINAGIETKSEYHHLDFALKSDEKCFIDGNEYNSTKQKVSDMVYEDPWEEQTSKFQRAFSQIRQGMVHRGRSIRKSILKRQSRIRGNDAYTVTELNHETFVYDCPKAENAKEDLAETINEGKDMLNNAEAINGDSQCTLRNKVNRQSKCAKQDTRRASVKLKFQKMFSLKTFKTPASFEQSNDSNSPDNCV
ncbi:unnamed protein product [Mytilus coruscus]|uniref:WSC domain-containing protein n=1 Tax=Mytilus coruscus TaxID=42192 RepID=A0A6J8DPV7_MYTCO|nr:unnamed protein product [Mytilus coruscus]